jgi:hypothetical protein
VTTGYGDPEPLIGTWLKGQLGGKTKVWWDPKPPDDAWITAPWVWVQRGQSGGGLALSLDDVLLDCDSYAAKADTARDLGQRVWALMTLQLPMHVFDNGLMVTSSKVFSAPRWAPDPKYRRAAAYEVVLHGFVA